MKNKAVLTITAAACFFLCGFCAVAQEQTVSDTPQDKASPVLRSPEYDFSQLKAVHARLDTQSLGALYPEVERSDDPDRYKFQVEFTSRGAGIRKVTLSEFDDRHHKNPQPLVLLSSENVALPASLANGYFGLAGSRLALHQLNWEILGRTTEQGAEKITFHTVLRDANGKEAIRLTKTFRVVAGQYDIECELAVENLTNVPLEAVLEMQGPVGIDREGIGTDLRKVMAAWIINEHIETLSKDYAKLRKARQRNTLHELRTRLQPRNRTANFVWAALTNKYFAAILRPVPREGLVPENVTLGTLQFADPDPAARNPAANASAGFTLHATELKLAPAGADDAVVTRRFDLYVGPKDRDVFESHPIYRQLAFYQTIDFRGCCCPSAIIAPLAFGIITIMKWMYSVMGPLGNYGVVIMILVFVVRLLLHPITKKSQVSMMKMQKLAPRMEEIKKKYGDNKAELNRRVMELYREQGASPVMGFLPMLLQMPIWIALWTAVYTSIELRGAPFLPFWITDLSAPDALFRFREINIPLLGSLNSFNLLPILMGVVMFLQQKLMPTSSAAQTNPQVAQQQKIMMIMFPLMFPIMLYNGPSGVNLYIMSSIAAGVIEQMVIRKHIREREEEEARGRVPVTKKTGGKVKKKKPKPFFRT
ncbi:MAG TPA: YidC/Oxa1 family insertase periplasmic-domain containing protein [Anaerohalosphaeraceae bacterium]|jgi:YidC/Oxa1 family membrane protein insertase|nr:YidC/Oxa1 family insertase periplasmic-domain containing protein [Anaerohalosphaeraceae bacterium]HRT50298.1 YidC/Oxa1 family insertase periplasmic-domain containing protein [Anaerohalosphaeraceae bacterium]HRT86182.1 YidC/Oxa1 family insertase periplasmic-domain containing protein [Anaerohalosphaeraceae bacterium]